MAWYNEFDPRAAVWLQSLADGLTQDQLQSFDPRTFQIPVSATSLPELEAGALLLDLQGSQTMPTPGQQVCHASRSALQDKEGDVRTTDTCFQSSMSLCESSDLQSFLENRLRQRMDLNGSPEYTLQWKTRVTSSHLPICQLRASGRRTSGKDSTGAHGYPAVTCNTATWTSDGFGDNLHEAATKLMGYPTVRATGASSTTREDFTDSLPEIATKLLGYSTLSASDAQGSHGGGQGSSARTDAQIVTHGATTSKPGQTAPRGALNPDFCRWLMGFPREWVLYGALAMQSSRKSPRSSLKSSGTPVLTINKEADNDPD